VPGIPARPYGALKAGAAGVVFYTEDVENQPAPTLHRYDLAKRAAKPFLPMVASYSLSRDGKKLLYQAMDGWGIVPTEGEEARGRQARARRVGVE
jgi:tricorn protease